MNTITAPRFVGSRCVVVPPLTPEAMGLRNALCAAGVGLSQANGAVRLVAGYPTRELRVGVIACLLPCGDHAQRNERAHELLRAFGFEARP